MRATTGTGGVGWRPSTPRKCRSAPMRGGGHRGVRRPWEACASRGGVARGLPGRGSAAACSGELVHDLHVLHLPPHQRLSVSGRKCLGTRSSISFAIAIHCQSSSSTATGSRRCVCVPSAGLGCGLNLAGGSRRVVAPPLNAPVGWSEGAASWLCGHAARAFDGVSLPMPGGCLRARRLG